ncbi:hypothetical protein Bp8pS_033 [Bacillus phage vB_BpuM-BpSp]|nr:hypothetical protein Bp8pS_033 [Bacillus phage vB_BpuM-BpSp]
MSKRKAFKNALKIITIYTAVQGTASVVTDKLLKKFVDLDN